MACININMNIFIFKEVIVVLVNHLTYRIFGVVAETGPDIVGIHY